MAKITVVAKVRAKQEVMDIVERELLKLVGPTRQEEGCLEYRLHRDNDDPSLFIFYENWRDHGCLTGHVHSGHFREYQAAVDGLIAEKTLHIMNELDLSE